VSRRSLISILEILGFSVFLAYIVPFACLGVWYGLTALRDQEVLQSPAWPCGPWEPGVRERVADTFYCGYRLGLAPGHAVARGCVSELRDPQRFLRSYGVVPFGPERPITCRDYDSEEFIRSLTWYGGFPNLLFWLPVLTFLLVIGRFLFVSAASDQRRAISGRALSVLLIVWLTAALLYLLSGYPVWWYSILSWF